jgi:hypothetical protein
MTVRTIHKGQTVIWVHRFFQRKELIVQNTDTSSEIFTSARSIWMALQACTAQGVSCATFMSLSWAHAAGFLGRKNIPFAMTIDVITYKTAKNAFGISVSTVLCCLVTAEVLRFSGLLWRNYAICLNVHLVNIYWYTLYNTSGHGQNLAVGQIKNK